MNLCSPPKELFRVRDAFPSYTGSHLGFSIWLSNETKYLAARLTLPLTDLAPSNVLIVLRR